MPPRYRTLVRAQCNHPAIAMQTCVRFVLANRTHVRYTAQRTHVRSRNARCQTRLARCRQVETSLQAGERPMNRTTLTRSAIAQPTGRERVSRAQTSRTGRSIVGQSRNWIETGVLIIIAVLLIVGAVTTSHPRGESPELAPVKVAQRGHSLEPCKGPSGGRSVDAAGCRSAD